MAFGRGWRRLRAQLELQQITRAGAAFILSISLVAFAAFASANNLLFLILAAMISTLLISGFVSRLGLAGLELELYLPEHIAARRDTTARIVVRNTKRWMPSFSIQLAGTSEGAPGSAIYFPVIPGGSAVEEIVTLRFSSRGLKRENSFQFSTRFPFGFAERRVNVTLRHDVIVYPCLDPQTGFETLLLAAAGEMDTQQRGRGEDFYRLRPYEPLESARHVDWKASAHTGALQVREFAREQDQRLMLAFDRRTPDAAWMDLAMDCCAYLAWHFANREVRVRFVAQAVDLSVPEDGDVYTVLKELALLGPFSGGPIDARILEDGRWYRIVFTEHGSDLDRLGGFRLVGPGELRPAAASRESSA